MTAALPILLMINGNKIAAVSAAQAHGIPAVVVLRSTAGETVLRCDQKYQAQVESWFDEPPCNHDGGLVMWC